MTEPKRDELQAKLHAADRLAIALERMIHTLDAEALHWPVKAHIKKCIGEAQDALIAFRAIGQEKEEP